MAVNCFVTEARRRLVSGSMRSRDRRSRTPYPRAKTVFPSFRTSTATPGSSGRTCCPIKASVTAS